MLHNFAGNVEMYGYVDSVGSGPIDARLSENSTMASPLNQTRVFQLAYTIFTCFQTHLVSLHVNTFQVGVGLSMEGIEQNPIVYELMSEMAFRWDRVDVKVLKSVCIKDFRLQMLQLLLSGYSF